MIALLLLPHAARAGTYAATYSGGTITTVPASKTAASFTTNLVYQAVTLPGYSGVAGISVSPDAQGHATSATATVSGQTAPLTAKFTWQPAKGQTLLTDPAPTAAIVLQDCTASCQSPRAYGPIAFSGNDGLGGTVSRAADASTHSVQYVAGTVAGDNSVSVSCSPDAVYTLNSGTAVGTLSSGNTLVTYNPTATPVTISLTGPLVDANGKFVLDGNGNPQILVGQNCRAALSAFPSGLTPSNYKWSVSGTTFQYWNNVTLANPSAKPPVLANSQASSYSPGFGDPTQSTASWYWNDPESQTGPTPTPETVSCSVTLTPPAGQGSAFTVTVTKTITVQMPTWTASGIGGYAQVNSACPNQGSAVCIYGGGKAGQAGGMNWTATVTTPSPFTGGTLELVQLATPSRNYTEYTGTATLGPKHTDPEKTEGLDTQYPYGWLTTQSGVVPYQTNDSPFFGLGSGMGTVSLQDGFKDTLMYQPPGSTQWVPRATFQWSVSGSATIPGSDDWGTYAATYGTDSAGTVTPSNARNTPVSFTAGNSFPSWTKINVFPGPINWPKAQ